MFFEPDVLLMDMSGDERQLRKRYEKRYYRSEWFLGGRVLPELLSRTTRGLPKGTSGIEGELVKLEAAAGLFRGLAKTVKATSI
jgi:hypothetical protein